MIRIYKDNYFLLLNLMLKIYLYWLNLIVLIIKIMIIFWRLWMRIIYIFNEFN